MNLWISVWQFLILNINVSIMLLPLSGSDLTKVSDVGSYFNDAFKCQFAEINSRPNDQCENNLLYLIIYNVISTFINILMFMMIKEGSATYYMIINTVKLPIQAWLGSFKSIAVLIIHQLILIISFHLYCRLYQLLCIIIKRNSISTSNF